MSCGAGWNRGTSECTVFLFGFEQGSGSIAVAVVGPSFPRPTSGPTTLTRLSLANFDRRFYRRQTGKNLPWPLIFPGWVARRVPFSWFMEVFDPSGRLSAGSMRLCRPCSTVIPPTRASWKWVIMGTGRVSLSRRPWRWVPSCRCWGFLWIWSRYNTTPSIKRR